MLIIITHLELIMLARPTSTVKALAPISMAESGLLHIKAQAGSGYETANNIEAILLAAFEAI